VSEGRDRGSEEEVARRSAHTVNAGKPGAPDAVERLFAEHCDAGRYAAASAGGSDILPSLFKAAPRFAPQVARLYRTP